MIPAPAPAPKNAVPRKRAAILLGLPALWVAIAAARDGEARFGAWVAIAAMMWLGTRALGIEIGAADTLLLLGLGALGVAVPTPGGVGSFHFLMLFGLTGLGVGEAQAQAAAILLWASSLVPILVLGTLAAIRRGVRPSEVREEATA